MRISELAAEAGLPLPTVKYYLREGLLQPGEPVSATRAEYDERHVRRLALVRTLVEQVGVPIARVRALVAIIEAPEGEPHELVGRALSQLPPYADDGAE